MSLEKNTYTLTPHNPLPHSLHRNKYIYINNIYTQNYELKCTIKYITTAYISKLLKLLIFSKI